MQTRPDCSWRSLLLPSHGLTTQPGPQLYESLCTIYILFHCRSTDYKMEGFCVSFVIYKANTHQQNGIIKPRSKVPLKITAIFIDSFDIKSFIKAYATHITPSLSVRLTLFRETAIPQNNSQTTSTLQRPRQSIHYE